MMRSGWLTTKDDNSSGLWHRRDQTDFGKGTRADMTAIGIFGARGRMGQAIAQAATDAGLSVAGGTDSRGEGMIGESAITTDAAALAASADVLIDFSVPAALDAHIAACIAAGKPLVIGTTGLEQAHHDAIDAAAAHIPILQTGNTSLGVNLLAALVREAAQRLGDDWDIEIVEMHHRHKVDAPSGTALLLGQAAAAGRNIDLSERSDRGRDGITGARTAGDIGFASLRGGSVAGDHQVIFASDGERIELSHRAENRTIFAKGAIKAAQWIVGRKPGRYSMTDVLGL
jgi:4-hydroxy-tetrahydrodipicolinate reductase